MDYSQKVQDVDEGFLKVIEIFKDPIGQDAANEPKNLFDRIEFRTRTKAVGTYSPLPVTIIVTAIVICQMVAALTLDKNILYTSCTSTPRLLLQAPST